MPKQNPFTGNADPLAPEGAWSQGVGAGGYGANAGNSVGEEYQVVDIDPSPAPAAATATSFGATNGKSKQQDLDRREADLKRREAAVKQQEEALKRAGVPTALMIKNWPPCMPIVHHDIPTDIPEGKRNVMRAGLLIYILTCVALTWNFIAVITAWSVGAAGDDAVSAFFLSAIYAIVGIPFGWLLWYKRLYRSMMFDGAVTFATFFCVFLVHIGFAVWNAVAPPISGRDLSHAGILSALKMLDEDEPLAFIFYIVGFGVWVVVTLLSVSYLFRVYSVFRGQGGMQKARREIVSAGVEMVEEDIAAGNRRY